MRQKKRITGVRSPPKSAANIILVRSEERPFRFFLCVRHMATKVVKFGGSSLADAKQIQKAAAIIKADPERRYVVPSAPGKRFSDDIKVTDMLYTCYDLAEQGLDYSLEYVIPEEGTNYWIDSWVIPANAEHKENAEKWIDFLCRPDIAKKNFEYITYATPNTGAYDLLDDDLKNNKALFPDLDKLPNCEIIQYLGDDVDTIYNDMWKEIKSE